MRKRDKEDLPIDPSSSLLSRNQADCSLSPFLLSAEEIHRGGIVGASGASSGFPFMRGVGELEKMCSEKGSEQGIWDLVFHFQFPDLKSWDFVLFVKQGTYIS